MKIGGNKLAGVSVGWNRGNNYTDLDEIELKDNKSFKDSLTTRSYESKTKARIGEYKTFRQLPLNADYFWTPGNSARIGIYHYYRGKITKNGFKNGAGSGLYLLKKKNPLSSIAGIVFEASDLAKLSNGFGKNFTINFIVGYNFGFSK